MWIETNSTHFFKKINWILDGMSYWFPAFLPDSHEITDTLFLSVTVAYYFYTEQPNDVLVCDTTQLSTKTRLPDPDLFSKLDHVSKV